MFGAANPLLHGDGSGNMYDPQAGAAEMGANSDHVPTLMAAALIGSGLLLFAMKKAGFDVGLSARVSAGR